MITLDPVSVEPTEATNKRILSVSEDLLEGFSEQPFDEIAKRTELPVEQVLEHIRKMLSAGTIRRVRQTLLANKLAEGALVAWQIPQANLTSAFRFLVNQDPFSGHVVTRSTDRELPGSQFNLWTTLKVPQGESLEVHANALKKIIGAEQYRLLPAKGVFTLGVGHMRRRGLPPGARAETPAEMMTTTNVSLTEVEWRVLLALKRELSLGEVQQSPWNDRAREAGLDLSQFCKIAKRLNKKKVIGRFSTFLEHTKPTRSGDRVTRYNGLFHWAVPAGDELRTGAEIGRHYCMTHCYWREGGPDFGNVNIMGVVHGTEKETVMTQKEAIDLHLREAGIPVTYTSVFWGGQSEIKPSEISPIVYRQWHERQKRRRR